MDGAVMGKPSDMGSERRGIVGTMVRWTTPSERLTDPEDRRRNRMVRSVALALALTLTIAAVISSITTTLYPDRDTSLGWGGTAIIAVSALAFWAALWASGHSSNNVGAWLTVITIDVFLFALGLSFGEISATLAIGFAVPVLCATLLLDIRGTLVSFALSAVLGTVYLFIASPKVVEFAFIIAIMVVVTVMTVLVAALRENDLAKVKQLRQFELRDAARLKGELELASKVQRAMLPAVLPRVDGLGIATYSEAAFEASGDFYDAFSIGEDSEGLIGLVVCDVAGKGVASALIMSATRAALRAEAQSLRSPGAVLAKVNDTLVASVPPGLFVTIFYGIYDATERELRYASGGHPYPIHGSTGSDDVVELESSGLPLGLVEGSEYHDSVTRLEPGDFVVIYTDGLCEALDSQRAMYGFDAVRERLAGVGPGVQSADELIELSMSGMREFIGGERLHDDVTVVALRVESAPGASVNGERMRAWTSGD